MLLYINFAISILKNDCTEMNGKTNMLDSVNNTMSRIVNTNILTLKFLNQKIQKACVKKVLKICVKNITVKKFK